jgi:hypothetical protein
MVEFCAMKITYRKPKREGRIKDNELPTYKVFKLPNFGIEELQKEYQKEGIELSENELKLRREALNFMHEIAYMNYNNNKQNKNNEESNPIHQSEYRRAS